MKYRAEIDGLRALAVVPVILFHAGFELFSGGFVGVDVFFVISGYLITTILIEDIENKRFSIVNFYERRARRILPALFFVMLVCIPFAWMWMLPSQMKDFSQSLVAVSLFASNILFWRESGYFAAAAEEKPLLHTWSLAVEEQYYVLFPIFLILAWRFGKNRVFWMIVVMAAISLLLSEWGWRNKATANFYLAPTRAWELFAGSIAAFIVQKKGVQKNNLLATLGLAAIIFSIFFYDETTPFPSVYALVPVLGVVLLVFYADKETLAARLLSTKGFVGIGLISYSAYLWHQPLFAFAKILSVHEPSVYSMCMLVFSSLVLGYLSWKIIEVPFRNKLYIRKNYILLLSVLGLLSFAAFGFLGHIKSGFGDRIKFVGNDDKIKAIADQWDFSGYPNHPLIKKAEYGYQSLGNTDERNDAIVVNGDSHAYQYWNALAGFVELNPERFKAKNIYLSQISLADLTSKNFAIPKNTKKIVLSYFWALHLNNPNVNTYIRCCGNGPGGVVGRDYKQIPETELNERFGKIESFIKEMKKRNIEVILVLDNPFGEELNAKSLLNIQRRYSTTLEPNDKALSVLHTEDALMRREPTHSKLLTIANKLQIDVIDPFLSLCDAKYCRKFNHEYNYLLYKDYDHLSLEAIKNDASYIFKIFD
ncbi:acyltransferase [Emcibacteraceae bacterium]|nr:acyltransferase [Emcibacteraceae bacterium]